VRVVLTLFYFLFLYFLELISVATSFPSPSVKDSIKTCLKNIEIFNFFLVLLSSKVTSFVPIPNQFEKAYSEKKKSLRSLLVFVIQRLRSGINKKTDNNSKTNMNGFSLCLFFFNKLIFIKKNYIY
jgi:hypothetical protein